MKKGEREMLIRSILIPTIDSIIYRRASAKFGLDSYEIGVISGDDLICREYRFHGERKWRFDIAIPDLKIAIEIDGGGYVRGRHNRATGKMKDDEKKNEAQILGWIVLVFSWQEIEKMNAISTIERAINERLWMFAGG